MIRHTHHPSPDDTQVLILAENGKMMEFNCGNIDYLRGLYAYRNGALIQDAFDFLSADEREFLISGLTPEEFDISFDENYDNQAGEHLWQEQFND